MSDALKAARLELARRELARRQSPQGEIGPTIEAAKSLPNEDGSFGKVPDGMVFDPSTGGYVDTSLSHNRVLGDDRLSAAAHGAGQGVSFGAMDEAVGVLHGLTGPNSFSEDYAFARDRMRADLKHARDEYPVTTTGAEVAGALAVPGATLKALRSPNALARAGAGAAVAGTEGAVYGFASGEGGAGQRMEGAKRGAFFGAGLGLAAPAVGNALGRTLEKRAANRAMRKAPDLKAKEAGANKLFDKADEAGGMDRQILTDSYPEIFEAALRKGLDVGDDASLTPKSSRAINRIENAATDPNPAIGFRDLDVLRRQAKVPASDTSNNLEALLGSAMVSRIDDVIHRSSPEAGSHAAMARKEWGELRRAQLIEEALEKAENYKSGFETGLQAQMRRIIESKRLRQGFSKEEIEMMTKIARGTTVSNAMRRAGKFGVGTGAQTNALMAVMGTELFGLVAPAIGTMAQHIGQASARRSGNALRGMVAAGEAAVPQINQLNRLLIEDMTRRGVRVSEGAYQ